MAQIFDRSSNALARMSLVLTGLIVIALGVTLDQLQRSPWVTRQGQRADQPVPFSHKHHVQGLGIQCQYCHTSVEKSSYAGIPPTKTCMNCHAQIWTNAELLEPAGLGTAVRYAIPAQSRQNGQPDCQECQKLARVSERAEARQERRQEPIGTARAVMDQAAGAWHTRTPWPRRP